MLHSTDIQALIFTKNSPLTPVFKLGTARLRENSVLGQIYSIWEGREVKDSDGASASKTVLSAGQVLTL